MLRATSISCVTLALATGCGVNPHKRNPVVATTAPWVESVAIETVAELPLPPGNVTVGPGGRVFFTFHPSAEPQTKVAELLPSGEHAPYPDARWQTERDDAPYFVTPLSLRADAKGRLWVLDHGDYGDESPSLTAFAIGTREVVHRFEFPCDVAGWGSMLNDFWVDSERELIYIADQHEMRVGT